MKKDWEKGIKMDVDLKLVAKAATIRDRVLSSEVVMAGSNRDDCKSLCGWFLRGPFFQKRDHEKNQNPEYRG